jgi:MarR family transcriptional regulator, lower aerobic nicotinate degradation pathway regulator
MTMASSPTASTSERAAEAGELPALPAALADRIGYLLAKAHLAMRQVADEALTPLGLDKKEYAALALIASEGPLSQQALSGLQGCDRTTMVSVVDKLEEAAFVERRRNPLDRRAYALETTAKGRRVLEQADRLVIQVERDFLAPLSASERRSLTGLLQRLIVG